MLQNWYEYRVLIAPLLAWLSAQGIKPLWAWLRGRGFNPGLLVAAGGMPSSHAALVASLATAVGRVAGVDSAVFAIAIVLAGIVVYDAAGVRWAASCHARLLNRLVAKYGDPALPWPLPESLGHTPWQVVAGALLGVTLGFGATCI